MSESWLSPEAPFVVLGDEALGNAEAVLDALRYKPDQQHWEPILEEWTWLRREAKGLMDCCLVSCPCDRHAVTPPAGPAGIRDGQPWGFVKTDGHLSINFPEFPEGAGQ